MRVLVFGGSGMLGSMVADVLSRDTRLEVFATARDEDTVEKMEHLLPYVQWCTYCCAQYLQPLPGADYYINCIGMTKPCIEEASPESLKTAIKVNSLEPYEIALRAEVHNARMIQIATDCVYSGKMGMYGESDPHDPLDVYGKTKSLGEVNAAHVINLRCSIVGPEAMRRRFLLEWIRNQPKDETLEGFAHHFWNGITTYHFAQLCHAIILEDLRLPNILHIVPFDRVSKLDLVGAIAEAYGRKDLNITETSARPIIDRSLVTENEEAHAALWKAAGYTIPPTINQMLKELVEYDYLC